MAGMITSALFVIAVLLVLAIIVALIRKYLSTRDSGFIWLGVAIVIWPRAEAILRSFLTKLAMTHSFGGYTPGTVVTIFSVSLLIVGLVLQLVAVLYLHGKAPMPPSTATSH